MSKEEQRTVSQSWQRRYSLASAALAALTLAFSIPLYSLFVYAAGSEVHSHILLIPVIVGYLLYLERGSWPHPGSPSPALAVMFVAIAAMSLAAGNGWLGGFGSLSLNDHLTFVTLGYVSLVAACGFLFLGKRWMMAAAFPVAFLIFMVPLPDAVVTILETASKFASADAAALFFDLTGTPVVRDGLIFQLPGIAIEVAQECSGIRSSLVLVITSLLAAHLFLKSPWRKILLVAFVIPLGVVRNGFRILVIGLLCVHYGPQMIHSVIHKKGGPLFFAISLIPLLLFVWWLRRGEQKPRAAGVAVAAPAKARR